MNLVRFITIAVLSHLGFISTRFVLSLYAIENEASTFTIGVILSLFSLIPMLISVRIGKWIDNVGPFTPTVTGLTLTVFGASLPLSFSYESADIAPLLVAASCVGTGFTLSILSMQQYLGEVNSPGKRPLIFSWFAMGVSISGFLGPVVSGLMIEALSHRLTFLLPILASLLAMLLLTLGTAPQRPEKKTKTSSKSEEPYQLLKYSELRIVFVVTGILSMCWDVQNFIIPIHGSDKGLSPSEIGFIMGAFASATFAIRLIMPLLRNYLTEWHILTGTLLCAFVCFIIFPLINSYLLFLTVAFLFGLGLGAAQPNIMTLVHSTAPHGRVAEALGLRLTIIHANQVVLPLIFGIFGTTLGTSAIFWTMAAVALFGFMIAFKNTIKKYAD